MAGTGLALDDGINGFKMTRVGGEADAHLAIGQLADIFVTEVVFHIAIAGHHFGHKVGCEFQQNGGERLAEEVRQHIEPPTM